MFQDDEAQQKTKKKKKLKPAVRSKSFSQHEETSEFQECRPKSTRPSSAKAAISTKTEAKVRPSSARPTEVKSDAKEKERPSSAKEDRENKGISWEIDFADLLSPCSSGKKGKNKKQGATEKHPNSSKQTYPAIHPTAELMAKRKVLDLNRWYCISRPQYKTSCGISSLVSCWNYLFSTLGRGNLRPITQEEALTVLDFDEPFSEIKFGPFTGNKTLMRWFRQLNLHYGVRGRCHFLYKPQGRNQTCGVTPESALAQLKIGLRSDSSAYVYHCQNHYFCPIGYEEMPLVAQHAYKAHLKDDEMESWILIGEPSRKHPSIHCKRWADICTDLNTESPDYIDIRRLHKGSLKRNTQKTGGNLHCIMVFVRSQFQGKSRNRNVPATASEDSSMNLELTPDPNYGAMAISHNAFQHTRGNAGDSAPRFHDDQDLVVRGISTAPHYRITTDSARNNSNDAHRTAVASGEYSGHYAHGAQTVKDKQHKKADKYVAKQINLLSSESSESEYEMLLDDDD